jgi:dTMP kinase
MDTAGIPFLVTREPGGTPIGETIRELLQYRPQSGGMTAETEVLLFEASRAQLVREVIKPALERGKCVIADRFLDSTTVYQGFARNLDQETVRQLNAFAAGDCVPNITFVLDVDLETARSRMKGPRRPDRMEQQSDDFYWRVIEGYREFANREPKRVVLIDGSRTPSEISDRIWETLSSRFSTLQKS